DENALSLRIAAPNRFKLDWVKSQFSGRITALACEYWEAQVSVHFVLDPTASGRAAANGYPAAGNPGGPYGAAQDPAAPGAAGPAAHLAPAY
ncbi:hypothetical protein OH413_24840, partial [Salmonella enterica]|nr:hypothetical protein [Salmonella enterica]